MKYLKNSIWVGITNCRNGKISLLSFRDDYIFLENIWLCLQISADFPMCTQYDFEADNQLVFNNYVWLF